LKYHNVGAAVAPGAPVDTAIGIAAPVAADTAVLASVGTICTAASGAAAGTAASGASESTSTVSALACRIADKYVFATAHSREAPKDPSSHSYKCCCSVAL
jgi:hypothetical protein